MIEPIPMSQWMIAMNTIVEHRLEQLIDIEMMFDVICYCYE
jgi:hypothetical protein